MQAVPRWLPAVAVLVIAIATTLIIPAAANHLPFAPRSVLVGPGDGTGALAAASDSLARGHGPAAGVAASCSFSMGSSASCLLKGTSPLKVGAGPSVWTNLTTFESSFPAARNLAAMVWDAGDGYVLLFGGCTSTSCVGTPYSDTWTFRHNLWTPLNITVHPTGRSIQMMAYDRTDKEVVMFGGLNSASSAALNETWTYHAGVWTNLTPNLTVSPSPRYRAAMAFDAADGYVVMFGGTILGSLTPYNETWGFVHQQWTQLTANVTGTPPGVYRASMAYDVADGYIVLFGGCTAKVCPEAYTYTYSGLTWLNITKTLLTAPTARVYPAMTYDLRDGYVLLFSGARTTVGPLVGGTWTFTGGKWANISANLTSAPKFRGEQMLAYDAADHLTLMYGGARGATVTAAISETWSFGPLLVAPATTFTAPFTGITARATHTTSILGCSTNATAKDSPRAAFNASTGQARLGSSASTGCGSTAALTTSAAAQTLRLTGPEFQVAGGGSYWVNATWNLSFSYKFSDVCAARCNSTNFGSSSYGIWINASLLNTRTHTTTAIPFGGGVGGYFNGTSSAGRHAAVTFHNVSVAFYSLLSLLRTDQYVLQLSITEITTASAMGPSGQASASLNLGTGGNGAWLRDVSVG
jgi:hypothetical protein